ncbi:hypothetical protein SEA_SPARKDEHLILY_92 [Mycobacterium phage Sparkdehlily]|uniref:Uncharacterized protein n=1 Tax=Mycobacterium phage Sparkdehlily TaxID=1739966 RepID=A0A0S1RUM9_9CAUD|nr:hypothetical protein SEA_SPARKDEHLILY_92 [Mycobacterium phage Sparkdehlily]ALM02241.1 hypothetical protein SEA_SPARKDEHLILY_92 [Mycobacterium phage Sparkdehlily]
MTYSQKPSKRIAAGLTPTIPVTETADADSRRLIRTITQSMSLMSSRLFRVWR